VGNDSQRVLDDALRLSEEERTKLISELIASLDGPADSNWDETWLAELDRRVEASEQSGHSGSDWASARQRILAQLGE